jgi:TonB family protein
VDVLLLDDSTYGFTLFLSRSLNAKRAPHTVDVLLGLDPVPVLQWMRSSRAILDSAQAGQLSDTVLHGTFALPALRGRDSIFIVYAPKSHRDQRYYLAVLGPPPGGMRVFTTTDELERLLFALDSVATINARRPPAPALDTRGSDTVVARGAALSGPALEWAPTLQYPETAQRAGKQGRVLFDAVLDTTGHVEPSTVRVLLSDGADFEASARVVLAGAVFRPARFGGRAVRARIFQPFTFRIPGR